MCSNYLLTKTRAELAQMFGASLPKDFEFKPHVFPRYTAPVLVIVGAGGKREIRPMQFGLIAPWEKDEKPKSVQHNARSETVAEKPWFRNAFRNRRCLVPMTGFFEWIWVSEDEKWQAYFHPRDNSTLLAAAIWDIWKSPKGKEVVSYSIVTRDPEPVIRDTGHDRCPVFLEEAYWDAWLDENQHDTAELMKVLEHVKEIDWAVEEVQPVAKKHPRKGQQTALTLDT